MTVIMHPIEIQSHSFTALVLGTSACTGGLNFLVKILRIWPNLVLRAFKGPGNEVVFGHA